MHSETLKKKAFTASPIIKELQLFWQEKPCTLTKPRWVLSSYYENKNKRLAEELIAGISFACFSDVEHSVINANDTILWPVSVKHLLPQILSDGYPTIPDKLSVRNG